MKKKNKSETQYENIISNIFSNIKDLKQKKSNETSTGSRQTLMKFKQTPSK